MSYLKSVTIEGIWDDKTIAINLDPKVNFLIGANGSGKTTVLQLIASALTSDYEGLARTSFGRILCVLASEAESGEIRITVLRSSDEVTRVSFIYQVETSDRPPFGFNLVSPTARYLPLSVRRKQSQSSQIFEQELSPLNELYNVKWLNIHRSSGRGRPDERASSEPSVDRQLKIIENQLVRYFSKLAFKREAEISRFLKQMLETLMSTSSDTDPLGNASSIDLVDLQNAAEALVDEFLPASSSRVKVKIREQFAVAKLAAAGKKSYKSSEIVALVSLLPMQKVIETWRKTQKKQEEIIRARTQFLDIVNSMYVGKTLTINQRNELEVCLGKERFLSLSELSSGEKQLLILFAEALLQEKSSYIYMADEPELSLHVIWQEKLTRNLIRLNPNAQVIFATHSPDIVGEFAEKAIQMEGLFT